MFPSRMYEISWKVFRRLSDENRVTSEMLLSRLRWPKREGSKILDIGCGDGLLAQEIGLQSDYKIKNFTLLDPHKPWLEEAKKNLHTLAVSGVVQELDFIESGIEQRNLSMLDKFDAILAIHLVYLLEDGIFVNLLDKLPTQIPLFVIMDSPNSVFSKIWERTQPKYFDRVKKAHKIISQLDPLIYQVESTTVVSHISNPLLLKTPLKEEILSILSYSDYFSLSLEEIGFIESQIQDSIIRSQLFCESTCYEIVRLK